MDDIRAVMDAAGVERAVGSFELARPCRFARRRSAGRGSGTRARSDMRSVARYPAARACSMASSQSLPTCAASWASESMTSGMSRSRAAWMLHRRVHHPGRVADAVAVQLDGRADAASASSAASIAGTTAGPGS